MKISLKDIFFILIIVLGVTYLRSCGNTKLPDIIEVPKVKTVVNNIKGKENTIRTYEKEIYNKKEVENMLISFKQDLKVELEALKLKNDLPNVVRVQDSIIKIQDSEIDNLNGIITYKDSIIVAQRYIIDSKDTLLSISNRDVRKFKKQRNIAALIALIEAGIIIVK